MNSPFGVLSAESTHSITDARQHRDAPRRFHRALDLLVAAVARRAGFAVRLTEPDMICGTPNGTWAIATKRLSSRNGVGENVRKAAKQISQCAYPGIRVFGRYSPLGAALRIHHALAPKPWLRDRQDAGFRTYRICWRFRHAERRRGPRRGFARSVSVSLSRTSPRNARDVACRGGAWCRRFRTEHIS